MRHLRTALLLCVLSATGCSSHRVISSDRVPDLVLDGAKPETVAGLCEAFAAAAGWRVERADARRVVVETPPEHVTRESPATWWRITLDLAPRGDGTLAVSPLVERLADGPTTDEDRRDAPSESVEAMLRAAGGPSR